MIFILAYFLLYSLILVIGHLSFGICHWGMGEAVRCGGSLRCSNCRHEAWGIGHWIIK
ncbi:hypothetical protein FDUTEX481_02388 [Tolypothrix sp. PCC 7601]|nr:hypothetical protein FDUTEX481_02388 [Tolypothrix sp. PCC 7601]